jgi:hypothetical protein
MEVIGSGRRTDYEFDVHLKRCVDEAYIRVKFNYEGEYYEAEKHSDVVLRVSRRPFEDPDPGPDPIESISSNLASISALAVIEDPLAGAKLFVTGDGGSEILDPATGALEHELPTLSGTAGTAGFAPGGEVVYTVIRDAATGAVRFETFDASTDQPYTSPDFETQKWLLGAPRAPHPPVRLRQVVLSTPGEVGWYQSSKTEPGPYLDGNPWILPLTLVDMVGPARKTCRAFIADPVGEDFLGLHRLDGETSTQLGRLAAGAADNPANPIEAIASIPAEVDRIVASGNVLLAWAAGATEALVYRRDGAGDFTIADGSATIPDDVIAVAPHPSNLPSESRLFFLCPGGIEELTVPDAGPPTRRTFPFPNSAEARDVVVLDFDGGPRAFVAGPTAIRVVPLGDG